MSLKSLVLSVIVLAAFVAGGIVALNSDDKASTVSVGGSSSPSVINGCLQIDGRETLCLVSAKMSNASTTCSIKTPNATTTIDVAGAKFTNTYGGSFDVEIGVGTNAFSTTTRLGYEGAAVVSGSQTTIIASTSPGIAGKAPVVAPNSYLNFKVGSSSPTVQGSCSAKLLVI